MRGVPLGRLALLWAALLAPAPALPQPAAGLQALQALDSAGRAIAAAGCTRPREAKTSQVGSSGDEMQAIDCRSFRLAIYKPRGGAAAPMELVVLAADGPALPALPPCCGVGADAAAVQAQLGPPARQHGGSFSYRLGAAGPGGDSITFETEGGLVRAVVWSWR